MKKIIICVIGIIGMITSINLVKAESFVEGNFINGEYVSKINNGKTYYLTMQFIKDSKGNIVYCMEPYITFEQGGNYKEYEWDLSSYDKLTNEQKRKIELLTYYGYGYQGRQDNKWYVITQVLIWQTIDQKDNIYFTDKLNGKKIDKYEEEINTILEDIRRHDSTASIAKSMELNYGTSITINGLTEQYEIVESPYNGVFEPSYYIENVVEEGVIKYKRKSNYYANNIALFVSDNNQDLIRPGNIDNPIRTFTITVTKGNIILDIKDDDEVYSVEKDLTNTCYEIIKKENNKAIEKICTKDKPLTVKSHDLGYGEYTIKQVSNGLGYLKDDTLYKIKVSKDNQQPSIILYNKLLKNTINITKKACTLEECINEANAEFEIIDKLGNIVDKIKTDETGNCNITVGYGTYTINQIRGIEGYTIIDSYTEKILDESTVHKKELYNFAITKEEVKGEELEPVELEELPPETGVKSWFMDLIDTIKKLSKTILKF